MCGIRLLWWKAGSSPIPSDVTKLTTVKYREEIAQAISEGIHRYREVLRPNEPTLALAPASPE